MACEGRGDAIFPPFLEERWSQRTLMKGRVRISTAPALKFLLKLFSKSLSRAADETAVALRRERNPLKRDFLFAKLFLLALLRQKKKRYRLRYCYNTSGFLLKCFKFYKKGYNYDRSRNEST